MKKSVLSFLASTAAVALMASAATAADLPARAAPPAPIIAAVPLFTWTGFYVGVNAGYGWQGSNDNSIFVPAGTFVTAPLASGVVTYGDNEGDGFVGGGQVGYNYQIGQIVLGVEADLQWADLGGDNGLALVPAGFPPSFVPAGTAGGLEWLGTVRARVGFAFDRALIYATGGFAYGGGDDNNGFNGFINNNDDVRTGWVLGGGVEYAFTNNVTLGLEGLWVNLNGKDNGTFLGTETVAGAVRPVYAATSNNDRDNEFFIARAKLNYKFSTY
jgi:outer membrane immunogenic protein